eukprot:109153-Alexandrium_andersonii.AAC.1
MCIRDRCAPPRRRPQSGARGAEGLAVELPRPRAVGDAWLRELFAGEQGHRPTLGGGHVDRFAHEQRVDQQRA